MKLPRNNTEPKAKSLIRPANLSNAELDIWNIYPINKENPDLLQNATYIKHNPKKAKELLAKGIVEVNYSLWATTHDAISLKRSMKGWKSGINPNIVYQLHYIVFPSALIAPLNIVKLSDEAGYTSVIKSDTGHLIRGNLFVLAICSKEIQEHYNFYRDTRISFINRLRMVSGAGAAFGEKLDTTVNLVLDKKEMSSSSTYLFPECTPGGVDGPILTQHIQNSNIEIFINPETDILYNAAMNASGLWDRFLFLWLAFESQTDKNGKKREKYILDVLKSDKINEEAIRLHSIRSKIAHGQGSTVSANDVKSISGLLRLTCIKSHVELSNSVSAYESWLILQ